VEYKELVNVYEELNATTLKLEKTEILADFLGKIPPHLLKVIPHLITGDVFPQWDVELGVGPGLLYNSISFVTGVRKKDIENAIREQGDTGLAVRELFENRPQKTLFFEKLSVEGVYENFSRIARASGKGAQDKKTRYLSDMLSRADPLEATYIVRTILSELRIGVAEGLLRNAIASAFNIEVKVVERAFMLTNDFGLVAVTAKESGPEGLKKLRVTVGKPLRPMLAQAMPSLEEAMKGAGKKAAIEVKYDGARVQIHKRAGVLKIFSRRLEDVTDALPDVVKNTFNSIKAQDVILDGEVVAVDPKTRRPKPFQEILKRFRRKYGVLEKAREIPFETYIFDILYLDAELLIDKPFKARRKKLEEALDVVEGEIMVADQIITGDTARAKGFYENSLKMGHEGVMVKNLNSNYRIGSRVGYMYKVKPVAETLDLVVLGAVWGEGKRSGWLSSYYLGSRDEVGEFRYVGRVATGLSETQLEEFTDLFKPLIEVQEGKEVKLVPKIVVEVGYQEIQKSPKYDSGFALRFPRLVRLREDKSLDEVDSLERIEDIVKKQG
jgi:DNA ligase-1